MKTYNVRYYTAFPEMAVASIAIDATSSDEALAFADWMGLAWIDAALAA